MASGWGCQYSTISEKGEIDWCRKLKHKCEPGCKGCILYGSTFGEVSFLSLQEEDENGKAPLLFCAFAKGRSCRRDSGGV